MAQKRDTSIAAIEARHGDRITDPCGTPWPCDALIAARLMTRSLDLIESVAVDVHAEWHWSKGTPDWTECPVGWCPEARELLASKQHAN